jgi:AAA domain, putative AbiEii toxin, Type IV TA system
MYNVQFRDFRCFGNSSSVEVRPITFLVGENSAGKTSFLAGVRFLLESFSRTQNPFNRDPYFLGGFEQIAHYRGGRGGRAKNFSLAFESPFPTPPRSGGQTLKGIPIPMIRHSFEFGKGYPQPELESYTFSSDGTTISVVLTEDNPKITIEYAGRSQTLMPRAGRGGPVSSVIKENPSFIHYLLEELKLRNEGNEVGDLLLGIEDSGIERFDLDAVLRSFRQSSRILSQNVFASAPVRTQPLRTYTPSEIVASSEGSHVPLELARTKRRSADAWKLTKAALETFGKNSGLFSDIEVRQLGRGDIDPFQVLVKINGPATNLVDVGYGVSQALPIVYQLQNMRQNGTFLLQQPEIHLHPRAQAEIGTLLTQMPPARGRPDSRKQTIIVETHSDYIIDRVRIEVARGNFRHDDVTIIFFERDQHSSTATNIFLDKDGEIANPPDGFRSFFLEEHSKLLGL